MKNIIFIAPPAAGKGTQSDLLDKKYGYIHISTGDLLRNEVKSKTPLGKKIDATLKAGELVNDDIVNEVLKQCLINIGNKSFILDGYPRTIEQAYSLEEMLKSLGLEIGVCVYLDLDETTSMHRALGRMTCPNCKRGYNKYEEALKPKEMNICDDCGTELISRSDDNEETFKVRFTTYVKNVEPLLDYYKGIGILKVIDNSGSPEDTFAKIESVI